MPKLHYLLLLLLTLLPLPTTKPATHHLAGKALSKTHKALQTRIKATNHRKDYVAKLAKKPKAGKKTGRPTQITISKPVTNQSSASKPPRVKPPSKIRNQHLAGKRHPKTNVPFDKKGFPDYAKHKYKAGKSDVQIKPTGDYNKDFSAANRTAGYESTPPGYTWHHHQEYGRMQLVESNIHEKTGHTGGMSLWEVKDKK